MAHTEMIIDSDAFFAINPDTREITLADKSKVTVAQNDHNSERFTFSLPRFIEGHDMTLCNKAEVHYLTSSGTTGVYICDGLEADGEDEEGANCTWLLSRNATCDSGILAFCLKFACVSDDAVVTYSWNTGICRLVYVVEGMNCSADIETEYADELEQLKNALEADIKSYVDESILGGAW